MSERLTKYWTPTSEGAFGPNGKKGDVGEYAVEFWLNRVVGETKSYISDRLHQTDGKDGGQVNWSYNVKHNLYVGQPLYVDTKQLPESKADIWIHVRVKDGQVVEASLYLIREMQTYVDKNNIQPELTRGGWVYKVPRSLPFITNLSSQDFKEFYDKNDYSSKDNLSDFISF